MSDARDALYMALQDYDGALQHARFRAILARHGLAVVPVGMIAEAADELAAHIDTEYAVSTGGPHPALARKYDRDMSLVHDLRAMLAAAQEDQR